MCRINIIVGNVTQNVWWISRKNCLMTVFSVQLILFQLNFHRQCSFICFFFLRNFICRSCFLFCTHRRYYILSKYVRESGIVDYFMDSAKVSIFEVETECVIESLAC